MLKNISQLEFKINEKLYNFSCDHDSPIEHVKEALFQFQKYVGQIEDAVKSQQEKLKQEQEQQPEVKEEVKE